MLRSAANTSPKRKGWISATTLLLTTLVCLVQTHASNVRVGFTGHVSGQQSPTLRLTKQINVAFGETIAFTLITTNQTDQPVKVTIGVTDETGEPVTFQTPSHKRYLRAQRTGNITLMVHLGKQQYRRFNVCTSHHSKSEERIAHACEIVTAIKAAQ